MLHNILQIKSGIATFLRGSFFERKVMCLVIVKYFYLIHLINYIFMAMMGKLKNILRAY
jgi:hypothetical protein